ncbi:MAG: N-acetyltransferase [Desulfobulbaceae bacterium]|nr:MAG: N-acetyltransferase [Desulfobulbaceae bacterium]
MNSSEIVVSTDRNQLDIDYIHRVLANSYWAVGIPKELVAKSIQNSFSFGMYLNGVQIGFGRVVTDFTTFAYLADVFIDENQRGKGFGKLLIDKIISHTKLKSLRRWHLLTDDAHDLYRQFGFSTPSDPPVHMEMKRKPDYQTVE